MKKCLLFHRWTYVRIYFPVMGMDYRENYRYCPRCDVWQIIIALRWFDCDMPKAMSNIELDYRD